MILIGGTYRAKDANDKAVVSTVLKGKVYFSYEHKQYNVLCKGKDTLPFNEFERYYSVFSPRG